MSSTVFEVVLRPDPILRLLVQLTGFVLASVGIFLILLLPLAPLWCFFLGVIWVADCLRELRGLRLGTARVHAVILDSRGLVGGLDRYGKRHELTLLTGSMVLSRLAWIRVKSNVGNSHGVLFTRRRAGPHTWHRLQLLWHQSRGAFGHQPGP